MFKMKKRVINSLKLYEMKKASQMKEAWFKMNINCIYRCNL